jgi:hypothetical protein
MSEFEKSTEKTMTRDPFEQRYTQTQVCQVAGITSAFLDSLIRRDKIDLDKYSIRGPGAKRRFSMSDVLKICLTSQLVRLGFKPGVLKIVAVDVAGKLIAHMMDKSGVYGDQHKSNQLVRFAIVYADPTGETNCKFSETMEFDFKGSKDRDVFDSTWATVDLHKLWNTVVLELAGLEK